MNEQELRQELEQLHQQLAAAAQETQNGTNLDGLTTFENAEAWATATGRYNELPGLIQIASFTLPESPTLVAAPPAEATATETEAPAAGSASEGAEGQAQQPPPQQTDGTVGTDGSVGSTGAVGSDGSVSQGDSPPSAQAQAAATLAALGAAPPPAAGGGSAVGSAGDGRNGSVLAPRPASEAHDVREMVDNLLANAQRLLNQDGQTGEASAIQSLRAQTIASAMGGPGAAMAHQKPSTALAEAIAGPVWDAFQADAAAFVGITSAYNIGAMAAAVSIPIADTSLMSQERIPLAPMMRRTLFDIVPKQTNRRGVEVKARLQNLSYRDGAAAPVSQAAPIPESDYRYVAVSDHMETIAEFTPFKLRDLQLDRALFIATVEQALKNLDKKVEVGIARGNGTDPNIKGITTGWSIPTHSKDANHSVWQSLIDAYYRVFDSHEAYPTNIVIHPMAFSRLLTDTGMVITGTGAANTLTTKSNNQPIWNDLAMLFGSEISPIILSKEIDSSDEDKVLIGDFSQATYYEYPELIQRMLPAYMYKPTSTETGNIFAPPATAEHLVLAVTGTLLVHYTKGFLLLDVSP